MDQETKTVLSLEPVAASALLKTGTRVLLDVRTHDERSIASIEPSEFIPLHDLDERWEELPRDKEIIVNCHHGSRRMAAAEYIQEKGLRVKNLSGGIDAWSYDVDQRVSRY